MSARRALAAAGLLPWATSRCARNASRSAWTVRFRKHSRALGPRPPSSPLESSARRLVLARVFFRFFFVGSLVAAAFAAWAATRVQKKGLARRLSLESSLSS